MTAPRYTAESLARFRLDCENRRHLHAPRYMHSVGERQPAGQPTAHEIADAMARIIADDTGAAYVIHTAPDRAVVGRGTHPDAHHSYPGDDTP